MVCRTVMIFLLAQRYNLCELFRYLEHARKVHRNVSRGFSKKSFAQKNEVLSEYSILILSFIFKKSQLLSLFLTYNLIGVSYGHDNTANFSKRSLENECNYLDFAPVKKKARPYDTPIRLRGVPGVRVPHKLVRYTDSWDTPCEVHGLLGHPLYVRKSERS